MNLMIFAIVGACTGISIIFSELYVGKQISSISILAVLFLMPILHLTQTPSEIMDYTVRYLRIVLIGLPLVFLYNLYNTLLHATGNTSASLYILLVSVAINLGLALYMVGVLHMGIAAAMILGHTYGASYQNAVSYLRIIAFFYTFCFVGNTFAGYLDGIEKVSIPFIGAASHIALRVILSWIFIKDYQLPAVAFATGTGWVFVNLFWSVYLFIFSHKKEGGR